MIRQSYAFEIITPCFAGGAKPDEEAEIRAASIRGQLRWWFRVLGGFRSLASCKKTLREQEDFIFGATAGDDGHAGKLMVRVNNVVTSNKVVNDESMQAHTGSPLGYLLFSLRPDKKGKPDERKRDRAVIDAKPNQSQPPSFNLHLQIREALSIDADIRALVTVFGHLGSLGYRSRRAMGALRLVHAPLSLSEALAKFSDSNGIAVFTRKATSKDNAIVILAEWLRSWRAHGKTGINTTAYNSYPGFGFAQSDHNARDDHAGPGYRAALGMPLLTKYGNWNTECPPNGKQTKGRFASPIILRPHRRDNEWQAFVIFVNSRKWQTDSRTGRPFPGYLDRNVRDLSLDLYDTIQRSLNDTAKGGGPWHSVP